MKRRATADTAPAPTPTWLRLREIHGNVTATRDTLTAWYVLTPQRWSFLTDAQHEQLIVAFGRRLLGFAGHKVHLRTTTRPYPAHDWAKALHEDSPNALPGWPNLLANSQRALHNSALSDKVVYLGVDLKTRGRFDRARAATNGQSGARREIERQADTLDRFADIVSGPGMAGRPATTSEVEWLIHRSIRLGMPAPQLSPDTETPWAVEDMHAFTDGVTYDYKRFGSTVGITANYSKLTDANGDPVESITKYVAVLTIGRMAPLTIPQVGRNPWMQQLDMLGFPTEGFSTFEVLAGPEVAKATARKRLVIRDMQKHHAEHGLEEPLNLQELAQHAREIEHEVNEGDPIDAARAYGYHRIAVTGDTPKECLQRVDAVKAIYEGHQIAVEHPVNFKDAGAQFPLYTEFTPGERVSTDVHQRRLKLLHVAAGLPHVSSTVGDRRGSLAGYTTSLSRRAFMLDLWYAMEWQEKAGAVPVIGEQGAGKSGVTAWAARNSAIRGITTTLVDPAGPLAALCDMPSLRNHARHLDLAKGREGSLNPYAVVSDPKREFYGSDDEWQEDMQIAAMNRKALTRDTVRSLLPAQVDRHDLTPIVLADAIRSVDSVRTSSLWDVVEALESHNMRNPEHARNVANYLRDMAEMPQTRLFFPNTVHDEEEYTDTLLVLTTHGVQLPDENTAREDWTVTEQLAVPILNLMSYFATRRIYDLPRSERKLIGFDELGILSRWASGRALATQIARNTRKWNLAALLASQNPGDLLGLNIANFISTAFVGRIEDEEIAAEALRLLRVPAGVGYEATLAGLSPQVTLADGNKRRGARDFMVKDVLGNVEKVKLDFSHDPELLAAIGKGSIDITEVAA